MSEGPRIVAVRDGRTRNVALDDLAQLLADPATVVWIDLAEPGPEEVATVAGPPASSA